MERGATDRYRNQFAGNGPLQIWANDSTNESYLVWEPFTVYSRPTVVRLSIPEQADAGQTLQFSEDVSGGVPPLIVSWNFGDGRTSNSWIPVHAYASPGNYSVQVQVADQLGTTLENASVLFVHSKPTARLGLSATVIDANRSIAVSTDISGGVSPYSVSLGFGDGTWENGSGLGGGPESFTHTYHSEGKFSITQKYNGC